MKFTFFICSKRQNKKGHIYNFLCEKFFFFFFFFKLKKQRSLLERRFTYLFPRTYLLNVLLFNEMVTRVIRGNINAKTCHQPPSLRQLHTVTGLVGMDNFFLHGVWVLQYLSLPFFFFF